MFSIATPLGAGTFVLRRVLRRVCRSATEYVAFFSRQRPVLNFLLKTIALVLLKLLQQ